MNKFYNHVTRKVVQDGDVLRPRFFSSEKAERCSEWKSFLRSFFPFRWFKKGSVSYLRKNVHWLLVNRLGGLSLLRKSVVRLTDRPNMTLPVDRGR